MSGIVADTSVWVDFFAGKPIPALEEALMHGTVILAPLVVAELVSGASQPKDRRQLGELLQDLEIHPTPLAHWIAVGDLRRALRRRGVVVSTPDAHVAQCAIERDAILLSRERIFARIARVSALRVRSG